MFQISVYIIIPNKMVPKRRYSYYNIIRMGRYTNNTKIYVRMALKIFVGIYLLSKQMTWLLMMHVQ